MSHTVSRRFALGLGLATIASLGMSPAHAEDQRPTAPPRIEMAILLDTSGSMQGLIDQARTQLWKLVNEFATASRDGQRPEFYVALYEYGKSSLPAGEGYMRMIVPLTDDLDKVSEELFKLTTNGGSEHCGQVIDLAARELDWSKSNRDLKCIFIAGNEPFTQGPVDYRKACHAAADRGITVSTIFCGPHEEGVRTMWMEGSKLADGSYMSIDHNRAVPAINAPQDKELAQLSAAINKTYLAYGTAERRREFAERQLAQDANAAGAGGGAAVGRAKFKASGLYRNAKWDLCDAYSQGKIKLAELKEDQLPEALKKLTLEQRKAYIEKLLVERKEIQQRIKQLSDARGKYVAAERKKLAAETDDTLDRALIDSARTQALRKNFKFE